MGERMKGFNGILRKPDRKKWIHWLKINEKAGQEKEGQKLMKVQRESRTGEKGTQMDESLIRKWDRKIVTQIPALPSNKT